MNFICGRELITVFFFYDFLQDFGDIRYRKSSHNSDGQFWLSWK